MIALYRYNFSVFVIPRRLGRPLLLLGHCIFRLVVPAPLGAGDRTLPSASHATTTTAAATAASATTTNSLPAPPPAGIDRPPPIVPDLPAAGPAPVLPPRLEAGVEFDPDHFAVELGPREEGDAPEGVRPPPVLDEGEAARDLAEPVEADVDGLDGPDGLKCRAEVAAAGGEGQVADVQGRAALQGGDLRVGRVVVRPVPVQLGFRRVGEEEAGGRGRRGKDVPRTCGGVVGGAGIHYWWWWCRLNRVIWIDCYARAGLCCL